MSQNYFLGVTKPGFELPKNNRIAFFSGYKIPWIQIFYNDYENKARDIAIYEGNSIENIINNENKNNDFKLIPFDGDLRLRQSYVTTDGKVDYDIDIRDNIDDGILNRYFKIKNDIFSHFRNCLEQDEVLNKKLVHATRLNGRETYETKVDIGLEFSNGENIYVLSVLRSRFKPVIIEKKNVFKNFRFV